MKKIISVKPPARRARNRAVIAVSVSANVPAENPAALTPGEGWIELFPYGLAVSSAEGRPVLVLKDARQENTLPVWMHPRAFGQGEDSHELTRQMLEAFKVKVTHCQINELNGHRQYATVFFDGHPSVKSLRVRADSSMSFCLAVKARFYSTHAFMMRCRDVDAEMIKLEQSLINHPEFGSKTHPYVM